MKLSRIKEIGWDVAWLKLKHMLFPKDSQVVMLSSTNGAYDYMRKYRYVLDRVKREETDVSEGYRNKVIWTCWLQGEEQAPLLVQRCLKSLREHCKDYDVRVIDERNVKEYVTLPDYIEEKYQKGIISRTHYSDLIRLELLDRYGGIWIDSTFLLTDRLPKYVTDSELFCYQRSPAGHIIAANPLITAVQGHPVIRDVKLLLFEYWKHENRLVSYSIFHLFFTLCYEENARDKALIDKMPYVPTELMNVMLYKLGSVYTPELWKHITSLTPLHKLTYRFERYGVDVQREGTIYDYIVNQL